MAAVGRIRRGPQRTLIDDYLGRIPWPVTEREVDAQSSHPADLARRREADLLAAAIPTSAPLIALDGRGENLTSEALASRIGRWRDDGIGDLACVIGGPEGLDRSVIDRAALVLAFGRTTWPHQLARVMLAEQLYRAFAILSGHPYHRG